MAAEDEQAHRAEVVKTAKLARLGWEEGMGVTVWARAANEELARHETSWTAYRAGGRADKATWERLRYTAALVVISAHQVYVFAQRIQEIAHDNDLGDALADFESWAPPKLLRDLIMHLDEYAVGSGHRQKDESGRQGPHIKERFLDLFMFATDEGGTTVSVGNDHSVLRDTAKAATTLSEVAERVRVAQLRLSNDAANAAFHRLHGLP